MIGLNPFLDSLCNFGFKNGGLHPGGDIACFPGPQDVVHHMFSQIRNLQIFFVYKVEVFYCDQNSQKMSL